MAVVVLKRQGYLFVDGGQIKRVLDATKLRAAISMPSKLPRQNLRAKIEQACGNGN